MRRQRQLAITLACSLLIAFSATASWQARAQDATPSIGGADSLEIALQNVEMQDVGSALFEESPDGLVTVTVSVEGLEPGEHGIHVHAMGICDPSGAQPFASAGGHYNPTGVMHDGPPASPAPATPAAAALEPGHAGDLGNITIGDDGTGELEVTTNRFTLSAGPTSLFDEDGSALLIHEMADDLITDPTGDSGGRVVCGVVAEPEMPATPMGAAPTPASVQGNVVNPEQLPFSEDLLGELELPEGFEISVFAQNLGGPRMMAVGPDGTVYVTQPDSNDVVALRDDDGNGMSDESTVVASGLALVHGIAIHEGQVFLAGETEIWVADIESDGMLGTPTALVSDLPSGGQHPNRTLGFGPDGMLYVSVGSTCNVCDEPNAESATILRMSADGTERTIFANGLRNTIGWGWHPESGELWGMDQGSDWLGDDQPPEELNRLIEGGNYGWPYCYADQVLNEYSSGQPAGATLDQYCSLTEAPALTYQAHSSPIAWVYYTADQFPDDYQGDAFVAMRGSWNRAPATGYKIVRVQFEDGQPTAIGDFITGWLQDDGAAHFGRVAGLAVTEDGSLLISEDTNGVIYRVTYSGGS